MHGPEPRGYIFGRQHLQVVLNQLLIRFPIRFHQLLGLRLPSTIIMLYREHDNEDTYTPAHREAREQTHPDIKGDRQLDPTRAYFLLLVNV